MSARVYFSRTITPEKVLKAIKEKEAKERGE